MTARTMDLIVVGIDAEHVTDRGIGIVHYGFPVGDLGIKNWKIPHGSTFDLSRIEVGKRYVVESKEVARITYFDRAAGKTASKPVYEWVNVREIPPKARTTTMNAKKAAQRREAEGLKPGYDDGLFSGL